MSQQTQKSGPSRRDVLIQSGKIALAAPALLSVSTIANAAELERQIGALLMIGFAGKSAKGRFARQIAEHVRKGRASSLVYLGSNIGTGRDVLGLNRLFSSAGAHHIAIDHEGGAVQRLRQQHGFMRLPSALKVAQTKSPQQAQALYAKAAKELAGAGFSLNLGPVVDLHRPSNPVIGRNHRAYGAKAPTVTKYAAAFIQAHRHYGIQTALKHFPGHGLSKKDSHKGFVDIRDSWNPEELQPFTQLIANGLADCVMSGHLYVRVAEQDQGQLTTFSRPLVQDVLRRGLRFQGMAMTDDLDMGAVRKIASLPDATIRAAQAGYDLLLLSNSLKPDPDLPVRAIGWISQAVRDGQIPARQIAQSAERVWRSRA
ncbi:MAG: hypothetical protein OIF56_04205 [Cohaesibacter sp.]|nr:hypothetical protein [Cohaesibacter sp.]